MILDFLAIDNFDFTRKIVQKDLGEKLMKMLGVCQNWIFGQKFDFSNSVTYLVPRWQRQTHEPSIGSIACVRHWHLRWWHRTWQKCRILHSSRPSIRLLSNIKDDIIFSTQIPEWKLIVPVLTKGFHRLLRTSDRWHLTWMIASSFAEDVLVWLNTLAIPDPSSLGEDCSHARIERMGSIRY